MNQHRIPLGLLPGILEETEQISILQRENLWKIIIHNDDVTPYDYVIFILEHVFALSGEMAEHVTWMAHTNGEAVVVIRPRHEAERLIMAARGQSRIDGFPLTFSMEQD